MIIILILFVQHVIQKVQGAVAGSWLVCFSSHFCALSHQRRRCQAETDADCGQRADH